MNFSIDHQVGEGDPRRFAEELVRDPTQLSPFTTNVRRSGDTTYGNPIPVPGMQIGVRPTNVRHEQLPGGGSRSVVDVQYSGAFEGPGRVIATKRSATSGMEVTDQWLGVRNNTLIPSMAATAGHAGVSDMGFRNIARRSRR